MKTYLKIIIALSISIVFLLILKAYQDKLGVIKDLNAITLRSSNALANLVISYREASLEVDKNNENVMDENVLMLLKDSIRDDVFKRFYDLDNSNYRINIIKIKGKQEIKLDKNSKNAISFLSSNKDHKRYFKEIDYGIYFFALPLYKTISHYNKPRGDMVSVITITTDNSKLKKHMISEYWKNIYRNSFIIVLVFIIFYISIKEAYIKDKKYLSRLKNEVNKQIQTIEKKNKEMSYRLFNDLLTKLPNRNQLLNDLKNKAKEKALILLNLDNFKEINDFYGIDIGDEVLVSFANFLKISLGDYENCKIYKLHADEYAILWENANKEFIRENIIKTEKNIKDFSVLTEDDYSIEIEATIGIAFGKENLLPHANMVLKRAKQQRLSHLYFDPAMMIEKEYEYNIEWTKKIKRAIKNDKIIAFCQPIATTEDKKPFKYEVLARMEDETDTIISPFAFLNVAKKNKLYPFITRAVIEQAFEKFSNTDYKFAINLSILDILNQDTVDFIFNSLDSYSNTKNVTFEILESEGIENYEDVLNFIEKIKSYGCHVAIDDFGSGYSNFEYMLSLKVNLIKIDASLIRDIHKSSNAKVIVKTIVSFAKTLGISTCAEFVHCQEVYDELVKIGVTLVQGYYIGKPIPINEVFALDKPDDKLSQNMQ